MVFITQLDRVLACEAGSSGSSPDLHPELVVLNEVLDCQGLLDAETVISKVYGGKKSF